MRRVKRKLMIGMFCFAILFSVLSVTSVKADMAMLQAMTMPTATTMTP